MSDLFPVILVKEIGFGVVHPENYAEIPAKERVKYPVVCWATTHENGQALVRALHLLFPDIPNETNCQSVESRFVLDDDGQVRRIALINEAGQSYMVDNQPHRGRHGLSR